MTVYVRVLSSLVPVPVPVTVIKKKNTLSKSNLEMGLLLVQSIVAGKLR